MADLPTEAQAGFQQAGSQDHHRLTLGATNVEIPLMGTGAWAWGDRWVWGYGRDDYTDEDIHAAYEASMEQAIDFFDTAEVYGMGHSETMLGDFVANDDACPVIATKFFPFPWRLRQSAVVRALRKSLERLKMDRVDLYQIHVTMPPVPVETWMAGLADAVEAGLTRAVGVSNYDMRQMGRAHNALAQRGVPLASNQVHYSLLHREPERNGVLQLCKDLNVTLIAYSPLEKGILTGKYTPDNQPPAPRTWMYRPDYLKKVQPLLQRMREIGANHGGKSEAQVALNWLICKGTVPIPGAKKVSHVTSNAGAVGWRLTEGEVAELDELSLL